LEVVPSLGETGIRGIKRERLTWEEEKEDKMF
jgi:hypothetical protein